MPSSAQSLSASTRSAIERMTTVDWLLAVALIVAIVTVVMWIYAHRNGDGVANAMLEEGFIDRGARGQANRAELREFFGSAGAPEEEKEPVKLASLKQLDGVKDDELVVLLVHHDQCIHCKNFRPMWQRLCQKYQRAAHGERRVSLYDISNSDNEALWSAVSDRFGVEGYPTVLFVKRKNDRADHHEYMGPRDEYAVWCRYIERQCAE